jgi:hypothetical protein
VTQRRRRRDERQRAAMMIRLRQLGYLKPVQIAQRPATSADIQYGRLPRVEGPWRPAGALVNRIPVTAESAEAAKFRPQLKIWKQLPQHHVQDVIASGALKGVRLLGKQSLRTRWKTRPWEVNVADVTSLGGVKAQYLPERNQLLYIHTNRLKPVVESRLKKFVRSQLGPTVVPPARQIDRSVVAVHEFGHAVDFAHQYPERLKARRERLPSLWKKILFDVKHHRATGALSERQKRYRTFADDEAVAREKKWPTEYGQPGLIGPHEAFAEAYALHASPLGRTYLAETQPKVARLMEQLYAKKGYRTLVRRMQEQNRRAR